MSKLFVSKRTRAAAWVILLVLPALMAAFGYYHSHRPAVNPVGSRTFWDYVILNSDILLGLFFLLASAIPFILVFDKKKPQARELVPIAVMAAIAVVGRTVFEIIPLPNFKPCSAIIIITAVAFGPEAGFLTGALTAFVSNFIFGQGPWTPFQMFAMGIIGFLAGVLFRRGWLRRSRAALCVFGAIAAVVVYGGIMNPVSALLYARTLEWKVIAAYYVTGFPVDCVHAAATVFFLWVLAEPMLEKLDRIKVKYGLVE